MKLIFLIFLLISCNPKDEIVNKAFTLESSDESFNDLKEEFENEAYLRYIDLSVEDIKIGFVESSVFKESSNPSGVALCQRNMKQILVNKETWNNFSEIKQEIIIFHELGHCALDRDHKNDEHLGEKLSLMHERVINDNTYSEYRKEYLDELFLGNSNLKDLL